MWATTGGSEPLVRRLKGCHTEIDNLDIAIAVQENVLRFEVAMADIETMAVRQSSDHLAKNTYRLWFWKTTVGCYVFEKLSAFNVLKDKVSGMQCQFKIFDQLLVLRGTVHPYSPTRHRD